MEPRIEAMYTGPAPFDYDYLAEQEEDGVYVSIWCNEEILFYQVTAHSVFGDGEDDSDDVLEQYEELEETATSKHFRTFLSLDRLVNEKIRDTKDRVTDTKYYGFRIGCTMHGGDTLSYAEAFNSNRPESREYLQVVKRNGKYHYSASHESYYMRIEMGVLYKYYFKEAEPENYFIEIDDLKDLDEKYWYLAQPFVLLRNNMEEGLWESGADVFQPAIQDNEDEYDPIVTAARGGKDENGNVFLELTLDYSRKNRYYLLISETLNPGYQVLKKSIFDEVILKRKKDYRHDDKIVESYMEQQDAFSGRYGKYFIALNKLMEKACSVEHTIGWRFGYHDRYGFNG